MRILFLALLFIGFLGLEGCYINANLMLKTDKNHVFDSIPENIHNEYRISPFDMIQFKVFSNDGTRLMAMAEEWVP